MFIKFATFDMQDRNWTTKEMKLFHKILIDLKNKFMINLAKKVLKKASTREVFEEVPEVFQEASLEPVFIVKYKHHLKRKKANQKIKM